MAPFPPGSFLRERPQCLYCHVEVAVHNEPKLRWDHLRHSTQARVVHVAVVHFDAPSPSGGTASSSTIHVTVMSPCCPCFFTSMYFRKLW
jgi:hypothetical protein